ncbi:hypothetical protein N7519_005019 [Penicillium mononematosum]|uniref:uncharacterized protein n=1 Tax=Penicillium mononematosum TaxID=268346 RepID=UPI002546B991|nr:uncharacterized protein N7519_005019 [Penicillium mononematosum]KAJ6183718.1 hypothetical protein N7519_005019 [Penicillium mononematosum]
MTSGRIFAKWLGNIDTSDEPKRHGRRATVNERIAATVFHITIRVTAPLLSIRKTGGDDPPTHPETTSAPSPISTHTAPPPSHLIRRLIPHERESEEGFE